MKEQSLASKKREEKKKSPKTLEFKKQINSFLEGKNPEIIYAIKRDLACMTSMPFYKDRPERIKLTLSYKELLVEFMKAFIKHNDKEFIIKLVRSLNKNQAQTIRKVAPRIGKKSEIWEHVIPVKVIVEELIVMVEKEDISELEQLLKIYELAGQRGITKEQDLLLSDYRSSMPENWNWRKENVNPILRHEIVGITYE
ncbi:hypothetical protein LNI90_05025 [Tenacibaculum dicentrarchi]|nr:hypothetical protein [Tenacibaculum dicentrarchi]